MRKRKPTSRASSDGVPKLLAGAALDCRWRRSPTDSRFRIFARPCCGCRFSTAICCARWSDRSVLLRRLLAFLGAEHLLSRGRLHHQSARAVLPRAAFRRLPRFRKRFRWRFRSRRLFAALLAMGRVMGDNEITAMRTSGIPVLRIALTPLLFGFAMFVIAYAMNEWSRRRRSTSRRARSTRSSITPTSLPVEPQFFRKDSDNR